MPKTKTSQKKDTSYFIIKSINVHGKKYNYSKSVYQGTREKLTIICNDCGYEFEQRPFHHYEGKGCPKCAGNIKKTNKQYIQECKAKHGIKYDYKLTDYKNSESKVKIICNKCNAIFEQRADTHLEGHGCSECRYKDLSYRMNHQDRYKNKKTTLYFIKVENVFKIGITLTNVNNRFKKDLRKGTNIEIINKWVFDDGSKAYQLEQKILKEFNNYQYFGTNILISGNSELFTHNIIDEITPLIELNSIQNP